MTRYVIDASVAVEYLLRTPAGLQVADLLEDAFLIAPELMDVEVLSVLRRAVVKRTIEEARALTALEDLSGQVRFTRLSYSRHVMKNRRTRNVPEAMLSYSSMSMWSGICCSVVYRNHSPSLPSMADGERMRRSAASP